MKNKSTVVWLGIVLVLLGILFLGNNLSFWKVDLFFDGWWTLFIFIPSVYGLFKKNYASSLVGILLSILLLLNAQNIISFSQIFKILAPCILIVIGLSLIFRPRFRYEKNENKNEYVAVFSENKGTILKEEDASVVSIFGSVNLDLSKLELKKNMHIQVTSLFGGVEISLPKDSDINILYKGCPIFGGVEDKRKQKKQGKYTIYIDYVCVFSGINIK